MLAARVRQGIGPDDAGPLPPRGRNQEFPMPLDTFLDRCRTAMRARYLSIRTEEAYVGVIRRYLEYHGGRTHPKDLGAEHVRAYLSHLAIDRDVAPSTQNVAFNALLY